MNTKKKFNSVIPKPVNFFLSKKKFEKKLITVLTFSKLLQISIIDDQLKIEDFVGTHFDGIRHFGYY